MNRLKLHLKAIYFRTLDTIDLDNGGKRIKGMSWIKSILLGIKYYFRIK